MKNIYTVLIIIATLFGCQNDIQDSLPAFQAVKEGDFQWKSTLSAVSTTASGMTTFTGTDGFGTIVLQVPSMTLGYFVLGSSASATATYTEGGYEYSTANDGEGSIVYVSDGLISIDSIDADGAVTGSFYFNAYNAAGDSLVNFSEGILYKLPLSQ